MNAEQSFMAAFERLKSGQPTILSKGSCVSQNNVAREAGCDPSALKKSRHPKLVAQIKKWIAENTITDNVASKSSTKEKHRRKARDLSSKILDLEATHDAAMALLVEADAKILELSMELERMRALLPASNVAQFHPRS
ncbi:hypothetical protein D3C84_602570 [compost metagenome]